MALIYEPKIFKQFPNVRAAQTLRGTSHPPYGFNMSLAVGDDEERVRRNRTQLAERLGFAPERLAMQRQVHGDGVSIVAGDYTPAESDAMITAEPGWLLAVSIADCAPVLLYDRRNHVVAGVHSGWRGTLQGITTATVARLAGEYGSRSEDMFVFLGGAAGQCCYEVGPDVYELFDPRYARPLGEGKMLFDNKTIVLDQLLECGVPPAQIELDPRCSICALDLQSYRRDGRRSGRMFGVIGMIA